MNYAISIEKFGPTYPELERLYRMHYGEMQRRLAAEGVPIGDYAPRLDKYNEASEGGWLLTFVVRCDGAAVGYSNVYLSEDMHNGEFIAIEDTIFVEPDHRNGIGKKMTQFIVDHLRSLGVKRASVTTATDPRVALMLGRMGWRHTAAHMTFIF